MAPLLLSAADVRRLLTPDDAIGAVAAAMADAARGTAPPASVLGHHLAGGGFHVKAASWRGARHYFAAKVNANFFDNPARGLPRIQGLVVLADADDGRTLAVMDSADLTVVRTAAATAVAARALARADATTLAIVGCGLQGRAHVDAIRRVRPVASVRAFDIDPIAAESFAREVAHTTGVAVSLGTSVADAVRGAAMVVTCTPSRAPILSPRDLAPGAFVAAVGADSEVKQELDPAFFGAATIVTDSTAQCAAFGDLHHAIAAGVITANGVHAELGAILAGLAPGRRSDDEVVVFDSTGVALQDVATAALVYERAVAEGAGQPFAFS